MLTLADTDLLLDLLREADDEPVTLDELGVAGVRDPAAALRALEEAGHAVTRVRDMRATRPVTCVRLAGGTTLRPEPVLTTTRAEAPASAPATTPASSRRPLVLALLALLGAAVLVARR